MTQNIFYRDFDVPTDLKFKTVDIVHMGGLKCSCLLTDRQTEGMLEPPNRITQAEVELSFTLAAADILVRGTIHGKRYVECARCLTFTEQPFREEFTETYSHKTEIIDIMYLVRQALALSEEIRFLCRPDCKGLCPMCGQNLNEAACNCKPEIFSPFAALKGKFK